jgi:hypothetical protein
MLLRLPLDIQAMVTSSAHAAVAAKAAPAAKQMILFTLIFIPSG